MYKHINDIKEWLLEEYDQVDLKDDKFICHIEYLDETHIVTPVMFTNDDKSTGFELMGYNKETNHTWEVGCLHVKTNMPIH